MTTRIEDILSLPGQITLDDKNGDIHKIELFGAPDDNGLYSTTNLLWWHPAQHPLPSSDTQKGEACHQQLGGLQLYRYNAYPRIIHRFEGIEELKKGSLSPSIHCGECGMHVVIGLSTGWMSVLS